MFVAGLALAAAVAAVLPSPAGAETAPTATGEILLRRVAVPVQGVFSHFDDFGDPRSGGRTHQGNDLMVPKHTPLLAASDGKVTRVVVDTGSNSGNMLTIKDADGWGYTYIHINNDTPGTDDGANPLQHAFAKGIEVGAKVTAGQVVAFAGDSGNAEGTSPHLHFEIHKPDGTAINPYPSLRIAQGIRYANYCAFDSNPKRVPSSASASGYWALGADGGVFSFGEALFYGSTGDRKLNRPSVGMASTPDADGYWFVASDGGIFSFGDARFFGSTGAMKLAQPIVGMAATPTGAGYWLVAKDGGIFSFGDARFFGSTGAMKLAQPIVGMAALPTAAGYWLVGKDGGIFAFGKALFHGSVPGTGLCEYAPASRILPSATGKGYWIAGSDGSIWAMGDAAGYGSPKALGLPSTVNILDLVAVPPAAGLLGISLGG